MLDLITFLAHPFVSCQIIPSERFAFFFRWGVTGQHRGIVVDFCHRSWVLLLLDACQSHSGEEMEGLTAEVFGGDFELVQKIGRSLKIVNPYFKRHWLSSD